MPNLRDYGNIKTDAVVCDIVAIAGETVPQVVGENVAYLRRASARATLVYYRSEICFIAN